MAWIGRALARLQDRMANKIPVYKGEVIYSGRDEYGDIAVVQEATSRTLHFGSTARQSTMLMAHPTRLALSYTRCMLGGLFFAPPPRSALMLGLGGGSLPKFLLHQFEDCRVEAVEMRARVVDVARRYFALPEDPRLVLHVQPAEEFLWREDAGPYDWLLIDLHNRDGMAPVLDHPDLFVRARRLLGQRGVLAANLWTGKEEAFLERIRVRLDQAFERQVLFLPVAGKRNVVALAFASDLPDLTERSARALAGQLQVQYDVEFVDFLGDILRYNGLTGR